MWITLEKPHPFNVGKSCEPHPVTPVQPREKSGPGTDLEAHTETSGHTGNASALHRGHEQELWGSPVPGWEE